MNTSDHVTGFNPEETHCELYSQFNSWMKSYTFIVQGKLKKIVELRRLVSSKTGEDFDTPESIIELCGCHPDTLDEYIEKLEEKLLPHSDYQDEFNSLLSQLKNKYPKDWLKMHPFYKIRNTDVDWEKGIHDLKLTLQI